jgi:hypothetical protein
MQQSRSRGPAGSRSAAADARRLTAETTCSELQLYLNARHPKLKPRRATLAGKELFLAVAAGKEWVAYFVRPESLAVERACVRLECEINEWRKRDAPALAAPSLTRHQLSAYLGYIENGQESGEVSQAAGALGADSDGWDCRIPGAAPCEHAW